MHSVQLTPEAVERIMRPVTGTGGFEDLLNKLQGQLDQETLTLEFDQEDVRKIFESQRYGPGGFQQRLAPAAEILRQHGYTPAGAE